MSELNWMAGQFVLFAWLILKIHRWLFGFTIKSANSSLKTLIKIHTLLPQKHLRLQNDPETEHRFCTVFSDYYH